MTYYLRRSQRTFIFMPSILSPIHNKSGFDSVFLLSSVAYRRDEMWSEGRYDYERLPRERLPPRIHPDVCLFFVSSVLYHYTTPTYCVACTTAVGFFFSSEVPVKPLHHGYLTFWLAWSMLSEEELSWALCKIYNVIVNV